MNFLAVFAMICSVVMSSNVTKMSPNVTDIKNTENKSNNFAVQFQRRFTNSDTEKWLFPTSSKTVGVRSGKRNGKRNGKMDGKLDGKMANSAKSMKRIIPARLCSVTNCYNCNHGLLRNIFKPKSKGERYCRIMMTAPDCCHNYFLHHGYSF